MTNEAHADIAIFGGGIAGLYTLNRLRKLGYSVVLFENFALGSGQSLKSQGIIHGGIKFALQGILTNSANATEKMPERWKASLNGKGELDLSKVRVLSEDQLLWSTGSLSSDLMGFFGSFALNSRVQKLKKEAFPKVLQHPQFKGNVWRLNEVVLDTHSLFQVLSDPHQDQLFKMDFTQCEIQFEESQIKNAKSQIKNAKSKIINAKKIKKIVTPDKSEFTAKHYLLVAGEGNALLSEKFQHPEPQQCRPLQMVMVKWPKNQPNHYDLFGHCIDDGMNPRITITTHETIDGKTVWYLGGQIAEDGAHRSKTEQLAFTQKELNALFPWLQQDLQTIQIESFFINRAEPQQPGGKRPDASFLKTEDNVSVAWPTKLALSPLLADQFIHTLEEKGILPTPSEKDSLKALQLLEKPTIAPLAWNEMFLK